MSKKTPVGVVIAGRSVVSSDDSWWPCCIH